MNHDFAPVQAAYDNGAGETVYDVHSDHLDTPKVLTDASDAVAWRASHEAFGKASLDAGNDVTFNIRFPGQYYDAESGLHYNRLRTYSPELGRFISADPIGQTGDNNVFSYALQNPIVEVDPTGQAVPAIILVILATPQGAALAAATAGAFAYAIMGTYDLLFGDQSGSCPNLNAQGSNQGSKSPPASPSTPPKSNAPPDKISGVPAPDVPAYNPDPTIPPAEGFEWRGPPGSTPGSGEGAWFNPGTGVSVHPDRGHAPPIGPHNDVQVKGNKGRGWRQGPDGSLTGK